jgi:hypothetical protein
VTGLADLILVVHFCFVLFVICGLVLIWLGAARSWRWVRNFWFRIAHLAAILFVAGESVAGMVCPLTVWEDALRGRGHESGFIQRWVGRLLYYDFPGWVFIAAYLLFALAVVITFIRVKPERP